MFSFPKASRLLERRDFIRVAQKGEVLKGQFILIEKMTNNQGLSRLGITATKRFGKSHERNRFKRLVREAFRLSKHQISVYIDFVVKPRLYAKRASLSDIQSELISLLKPSISSHVKPLSETQS